MYTTGFRYLDLINRIYLIRTASKTLLVEVEAGDCLCTQQALGIWI